MRMWLMLIACVILRAPDFATAQDAGAVKLGDFVERLALRTPQRRPAALAPTIKNRKVQLALVIDATATMEKEIQALAEHLTELQSIFGAKESGEDGRFEWSIVLYRDTEAPSGATTILERGSTKTQVVMGKLSTVKGESADPYPNNLVDQGLHQALAELAWKSDDETDKHLLLIGDSPAYGGGTTFRKHSTEELLNLAKEKKIRIHAIQPATTPADPDTAAQARRQTNLFYSMISVPTGGFQIDLANRPQVEICLGRAMQIEGLEEKLIDSATASSGAASTEPQTKVWEEFSKPYAKDVVNQRDLAMTLAACNAAGSPQNLESIETELRRHAAALELAVEESNDQGPLHLHCALAYDRLAGLGVYNLPAQKRSLYAWLAAERAAKATDLPESLTTEINAFKKLHVDNDPEGALPLLERLIELKDEKGSPGSVARARFAIIRLEMIRDVGASPKEKQAEQEKTRRDRVQRQIEALLRESPRSPAAGSLAAALTRTAEKQLWLHEDHLYEPY